MKLSSKAAEELKRLEGSRALRGDLRRIKADMRALSTDEYVEFVTVYNDLIGHIRKPLKKIKDSHMVL